MSKAGPGVSNKAGNIAAGVVVAIILVLGFAVMTERGIQLGGREPDSPGVPPDPFESDEPRVVECRANWDTSPEHQVWVDIFCQIGEEENSMESVAALNPIWSWFTTGKFGDEVYMDLSPARVTSGWCEVYVDEVLLDRDEFDDDEGCEIVELTIP